MKKVLILESSGSQISNLLQQLEDNGYFTFSSLSLQKNIIREIKRKQYDIALLNVSGGPIEDITLKEFLTNISDLLPVILVASSADDVLLNSLDKVCLYGCLVAPFSEEQLRLTIESACHNYDLTKKKNSQVKKTLAETERSYAMLLSNLPGMAYRCDNDRNWTMHFVSEGCKKLTGYEPAELLENSVVSFNELISPEQRELIWQKWQEALVKRETFQTEYTITTADGEIKWVWEQGKGIYSDNGKVIAIEGFITDITKRKLMEKALIETESRYRNLFENNHSVMLVIDPITGAIVDANPAAVSFYGWTLEEFRQKNINEINTLAASEIKEQMEHARKKDLNRFFFKHRLADGSIKDVEVSSGPIQIEERMLLYSIITDITERNRIERELRLSQFCIEHSAIAIFRIEESDGRITYVNEQACKSLGYSHEELCGMKVFDIDTVIPPYMWAEHRKKMRQMKSGTIESIHRRKDGTEFPVEVTVNYFEYDGQLFSLSFARDLSKRKHAEQALKESEELFRTTLYSIGDGVITTDTSGCLKQMNSVAEKLTGWKESEATGRHLEEIFNVVNEDTRQLVEIPVRRVLREGKVVGLANHTLLISRDNNEIPIADSGAPIINEKGEIIGVVLVFRDQSEERAAQRALMESEERFRLLVENAPEAIFVQTNGCFAYVNPAALHLFGADSTSRLTGTKVVERFHPDFRDGVLERIHLLNDELKAIPSIEEVCLRLDGTFFNAEVSAVPVNYSGVNGALVFFRDITERKQVENALIRAKMVSDEANRSKTEFLANTSHELKTPLNAIIGFSELLLEGELGKISEEQKKYIGTIHESGYLLLNIINKILDISSIDYGQIDLEYTKFNLCEAIQDTCTMVQVLANRKAIELIVDVDTQINEINADIIKFKEIVYNLVDNSVKFTPSGGTVVIIASQNENHVEISVADNGIGIAQEDIDRIFDPFYQVDSSTTRRYGGTGLGLTLIKQFIIMHGGNIRVESEPGKGSTFTFTIPLGYGCESRRKLSDN